MKELKRIFSNRRLVFGMLLIVFINGILFCNEQVTENYGLDLSGPSSDIISAMLGGTYETEQIKVDGMESYANYQRWMEKYKNMPLAETAKTLEQEKSRLEMIFEVSELIRNDGGMFGQEILKKYREEQPELIEQLENGETDLDKVQLDYIAVNNLLHQIDYLSGYDDYLASIQGNKESMLSFSIFNDQNSFSNRNIIETAEDFGTLTGVSLEIGADGAVDAFMSFSMTDFLLLAVLAVICISFLEERQKGLWSVVHASSRGRLRLALHRAGILFGLSVVSVLLLYGTNLVLGFSMYGGIEDLGRAAQSVEILGRLPVLCTVGQFLMQYILLRIAAAFFVALLLWMLLTVINNVKYTIIVAAGVLTVEYGFYTFLPVQSFLNVFKYFNIFTYISLRDLYTNYLNIDLFGYPVGIRSISGIAMLPIGLLLTCVCIAVHCHKKPAAGKDLLGRVAYRLNSLTDKGLHHLRLLGMEMHKTLFIQKGIVVLLLFVYLISGLSFITVLPANSSEEIIARQYTVEFEGAITDSTFKRMDEIQAELNTALAAFDVAQEQYESGKMEYPQFDGYAREGMVAEVKLNGLRIVRERAEDLCEQGAQNNFEPWLIEDTPYESVYGSVAQGNQKQAAVLSLLALILLLAGSMAYEKQSGMTFLLASTPRGRNTLLCRKTCMAAVFATVVWSIGSTFELHALLTTYTLPSISAPVQNLAMLENFPLHVSIGGFLILLYASRLFTLLGSAMIVLFLSSLVKRLEAAYIVCCALLLPSLLYHYAGITVFRYLSLALGVEVMPLLINLQGDIGAWVLCTVVVLVMGGFSVLDLSVLRRRRGT